MALPWIILFTPLISAALILFVTKGSRLISSYISVGAVVVSFVASLIVFALPDPSAPNQFAWLSLPGFEVPMGVTIDQLSKVMLLVVTTVGLLVHVFSLGYMADDEGKSRYFAGLSLFMFSMLGIVLANNFVMMFIFWELVGVSSYILIGHWFSKKTAADAALKAFVCNRLGDFGFMLGILLVWLASGSVVFSEIAHRWPVAGFDSSCFLGAAAICIITSVLAALMATQQNDIKRILAYSTLSQLGYMVMAVGLKSPEAAMYHLFTHAFFKALLFLGSGAVIYAVHHEQDIWKMGGLHKKMPVTFYTFLAATLALTGCPGLSGFFSKETILDAAYEHNRFIFWLALGVAFMTAFYMFRLFTVVFLGAHKSDHASHAHEVPLVMSVPLMVLGFLSVFAGYSFFAGHFLKLPNEDHVFHLVTGLAVFVFVAGAALAYAYYKDKKQEDLIKVLANKFYIDEIYAFLVAWTQDLLAGYVSWFDRWVLDWGIVRWFFAGGTYGFGLVLRFLQIGNLQAYAFIFGAGAVALIYYILFK